MNHARVALLVTMLLLSLPLAVACHGQYGSVRPRQLEKEYHVSWGSPLVTEGVGVWEETNGLTGLQCEPTILWDGTVIPPDEKVL